ncbi:hypothetical protein FQN49_007198 [Arthroderma sp. PD_2]|nr:hypothetical protein FQN49_007198 [Arthroderma sp. PD_2]
MSPGLISGRCLVFFLSTQVTTELAQYYHVRDLEDVRVIRDRQTKISRQLAFIRFPTVDDSREFLEQNFPAVYLYGKGASTDGQGAKVRIAYSREREDRNRGRGDGEWTCINVSLIHLPLPLWLDIMFMLKWVRSARLSTMQAANGAFAARRQSQVCVYTVIWDMGTIIAFNI